jgi:hypothetical protein
MGGIIQQEGRGSTSNTANQGVNAIGTFIPGIVTVDSNGGWFTSLALNASGYPVIAYYDNANGNLQLAVCHDASCTTPTLTLVDGASEDVGGYLSLALNSGGYPVISYYDYTNGRLKLAVCNDATCTSSSFTIVAIGNGMDTSLALGAGDKPVISYLNGSGSVAVAVCNDTTCTSPTTAVIDSGRNTSLKLNASDYPVISYLDTTNYDLKVAVCNDANCTAPTLTTVDNSTNDVGWYNSLALNASGNPVISYYDMTTGDLKVAVCSNATCTTPSITTLDSDGDVGIYPSIALNASGFPTIAYYDSSHSSLKLAVCGNEDCTLKNRFIVVDGGSGLYASLQLDANGNAVIAYSGGSVKVAWVDLDAPTVDSFILPSTSSSLNISISEFTASDNVGVTGYMITDSDVPPAPDHPAWEGSAPLTFTVPSAGDYTLYPWVKDAASNVSDVFASPASVSVTPNSAPTDMTITNLVIPENIAVGSLVAELATVDPDAGDTHTYSVIYTADAAHFNLVDNKIYTAMTFDRETQQNYYFWVRTTDSGGLQYDEMFVITVLNVNEPPTDMTITNLVIPENIAVGSLVAELATVDPDAGDTHTYSVIYTADAAHFNLVDNKIYTAMTFDRETQQNYYFWVRTTDSGGLQYDEMFIITVLDINETPSVLNLSNSSVAGGLPIGTYVGTFSSVDPDAGDSFMYTLVPGTGDTDNASFTITGNELHTAAVLNALVKNTYTIRVRTTDSGTLWLEQTFTITVTANSNTPTIITPTNGENLLTNRPFFDWTDVPGARLYQWQVSRYANFSVLHSHTSVTTSEYTPSRELFFPAQLYWRVRAYGPWGYGPWTTAATFYTANAPRTPVLVAPAINALTWDYTPRFDWNYGYIPTGTTLDYYQLQVSTAPNFLVNVTNEKVYGLLNSEYTPATDLASNTKYYWRVRSFNTAGEYSGWSLTRYFRTAMLPPEQTSPVNGLWINERRPTFDWDEVAGATSYTLLGSRNQSLTTGVVMSVTIPATAPSNYTPVTPLPYGTVYWWVKANGINGPSQWSPMWHIAIMNPPVLQAPAMNSLLTTYTPTLQWARPILPAAGNFGRYQIQIATDEAFTNIVQDADVMNYNTLTYTAATLAPNTTYYWRVRSFNWSGANSLWSVTSKFRTVIRPPQLLSPGNTAVIHVYQPLLDWDDLPGATAYQVQTSRNSTFTNLIGSGSVTSSSALVNVPKNVTIYWRVRAYGPNGPSAWSEVWSFTKIP